MIKNYDPHECILWDGYPNTTNGQTLSIVVDGVQYPIRRYVYMETWGPIPSHYEVGSFCGVNRCVNVDHLYAADRRTRSELERIQGRHTKKKRTHCKRGHPLVEGNIRYRKGQHDVVDRLCLTCCLTSSMESNRVRGGENYRTRAQQQVDRENQTHCINGHPWTEENTYIHTNAKYRNLKYRSCRACRNIHARESRERRKNGIRRGRPKKDSTAEDSVRTEVRRTRHPR